MLSNIFNVTVEIAKNSQLKYEISKVDGKIHLDRVLFGSNVYPHNYGYIAGTLDHDGDPLDVVIISQLSLIPGCIVECRVLGALNMIDNNERDTKLIAVINVDHRYKAFDKLSSIPTEWLLEVKDFFTNYKNLENKIVETQDFIDWNKTELIIKEGIELYNKKK